VLNSFAGLNPKSFDRRQETTTNVLTRQRSRAYASVKFSISARASKALPPKSRWTLQVASKRIKLSPEAKSSKTYLCQHLRFCSLNSPAHRACFRHLQALEERFAQRAQLATISEITDKIYVRFAISENIPTRMAQLSACLVLLVNFRAHSVRPDAMFARGRAKFQTTVERTVRSRRGASSQTAVTLSSSTIRAKTRLITSVLRVPPARPAWATSMPRAFAHYLAGAAVRLKNGSLPRPWA
jgi:hypothetical protein